MNQIICAHKLSPLPFLPVPPSRTSWQVIVSHPTEGDRYEIDRYSVANTEPTPPPLPGSSPMGRRPRCLRRYRYRPPETRKS